MPLPQVTTALVGFAPRRLARMAKVFNSWWGRAILKWAAIQDGGEVGWELAPGPLMIQETLRRGLPWQCILRRIHSIRRSLPEQTAPRILNGISEPIRQQKLGDANVKAITFRRECNLRSLDHLRSRRIPRAWCRICEFFAAKYFSEYWHGPQFGWFCHQIASKRW